MANDDFTPGNQLLSTQTDADSPVDQALMDTLRERDNEIMDKLVPMGGTSNDGAINITTAKTWGDASISSADGLIDCTTFNLDAGVTLTGLSLSPIIIRASTSITISGTIDCNGMGAAGGATNGNTFDGDNGSAGIGGSGGAGGGNSSNGNGGNALFHSFVRLAGGTVTGAVGNNGVAVNNFYGRMIHFGRAFYGGAGGGGGFNEAGTDPGVGGAGGGVIFLESPIIIIDASGIVRANGIAGGAATGLNSGSGGGGGGGFILMRTKTLTNAGTVTASGGAGGVDGHNGGAGGTGIVIEEEF